MKSKRYLTQRALPRRNALIVALALGMGISGLAYGQATTGAIFGNAPQQAGETVMIKSGSGLTRTVPVIDGTYTVGDLPLGSYTVTLLQNGEAVKARNNVRISVGAGTQVNFSAAGSANAQTMGAVQVTANALPSIDVSSVSSTFTLDATQLQKLPLGQSADAIALLAPGATAGSNYFGGISFGGAGVTENAYYINGWNTTSLYNYTGTSYSLPYGAIAQQQTITGGFSAKYGRADGGVINQIGKRGTNQWHFGARIQWVPRSLRAAPRNTYYPDVKLTGNEAFTNTTVSAGELYRYRNANKGWDENLSAYVGGPLIKDKLFFFVAGEGDRSTTRSVSSVTGQQDGYYNYHSMKWYGKIDWNINDSNLFEYTLLKDNERNGYGDVYRFDNTTRTDTDFLAHPSWGNKALETQIFHYTGYLTDNATLSILYGKTTSDTPTSVPNPSPLPYIGSSEGQNPDYFVGGLPVRNGQTALYLDGSAATQRSNGLRVDFSYNLGDHLLSAGIDNLHYWAEGQGHVTSGPGYAWYFGHNSDPSKPINQTLGVGAPGGNGYYADKYINITAASMSARQQAWYVMDKWQMTPNFLLSLGLRNDSFTNYNPDGVAFVSQQNQYEPRVGFSWDVNGDSSFKIYGNVGRYFLALPQATANRTATASVYTDEYFTYTGLDSNGIPTGLTPVGGVNPATGAPTGGPAGPVSANGEFGNLPDPQTVAALNLKPQYQDEYILGFDKKWGPDWVYGATATYRTLGTLIDDGCYGRAIAASITKMGLDPNNYDVGGNGCHLFNPNRTNVYKIPGLEGRDPINVSVSQSETGLPDAQRDYYALNLYLEHPFDGTWFGRIDYTFARSWGNSEGQVRSDIGQGDISITEDWDYAELMVGSRGYLANNIRHQLKAYGAWQITPEWMLSGNLTVESGRPVSCLGFFGRTPTDTATNNPGAGYGSDYHWCEGKIATPGADTTPWTKQLDLGVTYSPSFANHNLKLKMYVFNVFNEQEPIQLDANRFARYTRTVSNTYHMPTFYESPRYVRFTITYDY